MILSYKTGKLQTVLSAPVLFLPGWFSYSAFLILVAILWPLCRIFQHIAAQSVLTAIGVEFFVVFPIIIGLSYLFHIVFERPYKSSAPVYDGTGFQLSAVVGCNVMAGMAGLRTLRRL